MSLETEQKNDVSTLWTKTSIAMQRTNELHNGTPSNYHLKTIIRTNGAKETKTALNNYNLKLISHIYTSTATTAGLL